MSAICGILNLDGAPVHLDNLHQMVTSSPYRGDDGVGYWREGNIGLAHRAFHITPESVLEKQPLKGADGKLVLVADVRLDNREELIHELPEAPDQPTDPDLLLAAYRRWGDACVEHLLGDFAFVVWNSDKRELFLARDPLGAYGFFYHFDGKHFLFASELPAILSLPGFPARINEITVTKHLVGHLLDSDETYFQSVYYCPPAHCMKLAERHLKRWRYWDIDPEQRIQHSSDDDYTDHFLELLTQSVSDRLRTRGQVGLSLSGGCDSSLIAAIASNLLPKRKPCQEQLKTFSYVFDEFPECDERAYMQPIVEQYNLDPCYISGDDKTTLSHLEEQAVFTNFFSYDCYSLLPISTAQAAQAAGCQILLDGNYGDTLFDAPNYFVADAIAEKRFSDLYRWYRKYRSNINWRYDVIKGGLRPMIPQNIRQAYRRFRPRSASYMNAGLKKARMLALSEHLETQSLSAAYSRMPPGRQLRYHTMMCSSWPNGYVKGRSQFGNAFGVERISPYFDRRLVEFVLAIPPDQIGRPGQHRFLQKNAMRRLLPAEVIKRKNKTTFEPLLVAGLRQNRASIIRNLAKDPLIIRRGWVREKWFRNQLEMMHPEHNGFPLSISLHLELWLRAVEKAQQTNDWSPPYHVRTE